MAEDVVRTAGSDGGSGSTAPRHGFVRIRHLNALAIVLAAAIALFALIKLDQVITTESDSERVNSNYHECLSAARDLMEASDYLTTSVRMYVVTSDAEYRDNYIEEIEQADRRGQAVETLRSYLGTDEAVSELEEALSYSNELAVRELYAMRLMADVTGEANQPALVSEVVLDPADAALVPDDKYALARDMMLGEDYRLSKEKISSAVNACSEDLLASLGNDVLEINQAMHRRLVQMEGIVVALLAIVVFVIFATIFLVLWPMATYAYQIKHGRELTISGADELRYLAESYNLIYEENRERTLRLQHKAERDGLTGLFNRMAYDALMEEHIEDVALMLIDVDYFKNVNDGYGHEVGDRVLCKVGEAVLRAFRETDYVCRIGGDEFAVIMTHITPERSIAVASKIEAIARALRDTSDGLPETTLSIGVAFSAMLAGDIDMFRAADQALYVVKERGRDGYEFYDGN